MEKKQNIKLCAYLWISISGNLREKITVEEVEEVEEVEKGERRKTYCVHRSLSEGGGRRTQGKPEWEMGGVGEREKEGRKTHLSTVA